MKSISDYTIYCTPEQTRKALELGAPIYMTFAPGDYIEPILAVKDENSKEKNYLCPTAEQMIGFLETKGVFVGVAWNCILKKWDSYTHVKNDMIGYDCYDSREEATIAAIDAALDYLESLRKFNP